MKIIGVDTIVIDRCFCGRKHRKGSTASFVCARSVRTMIDAYPSKLVLDTDDDKNDRLGGTE